ncbi:MAG: PAS domain S-box protein [Candidatus Aminicenantes bacterium]|nr:PAS domain S-box protein [Candidatus Aminicenantes bacterium]
MNCYFFYINIYFRSRKIRFLNFAIIITLTVASLQGGSEIIKERGLPYIRSYDPKEYGAQAQNWAIIQDKRGVIYIGNGDGVLEYDGISWRLIPSKNKTAIRSLAVDDAGRVYVGAQGEIGYLAPDETGKMRFVSLNDLIETSHQAFLDVWDIYVTSQGVFFNSRANLFLLANNHIKVWKAQTGFHRAFLVYGRLFIRQDDVGLMELSRDKLVLVKGGERFAFEKIYVMLPFDMPKAGDSTVTAGRVLIGTRDQGFFLYDGATLSPFPTAADTFLKKNLLYHGVLLNDGTLALATLQGGMACISRDGKMLSILDKTAGLIDNTVLRIQPDQQSGLWLTHNKGLSRIEWPAPLTIFDERSGLKGSVLFLHGHKGTMYVGTSQGVYVLQPPWRKSSPASPGYRFECIAGMKSQTFNLLSFGGILLATGINGVSEIRGREAFLVRPSNVIAMSLFRSRSDPARVFVGLQDGLASMVRRGEDQGRWIDEGKITGINEEIRNMAEMEDGRLWLGTQAQGILRITFSRDWQGGASGPSPLVERFGSDQGLPIGLDYHVHTMGGTYVFGTPQGVYRFDETAKHFSPDPRFARLFPDGFRKVLAWREDSQGRIWMDSIEKTRRIYEAGAAVLQPDGSYRWEKTPFLRIGETAIETIHADADGVVWFGGSEGLSRYDPRIPKDYTPAYSALIRRVEKARGQLLFGGASAAMGSKTIPALKYTENSLRFEFALTAFDEPEANRYKIRMDGLDREWSDWTAQNMKEYMNLPEGSYVFRVKARNIYQQESGEDTFKITVIPPFWKTWWFRVLVALAIVSLVVFVSWARTRSMRIRNEELSELNEQLDSSNRKLAVSNQDLNRANVELKKTNQELEASEEKYRNLIQQSNDAIYLLYDKKFEVINDKFQEIFGLTLEEVNGPDFDFMDLVAPKSKAFVAERSRGVEAGEEVEPVYEFTALAKDGKELDVEVSTAHIKYKNGIATQGILKDITQRKKLEQQLIQTQKMESIGTLAGGIAHDFNNLLTVISGYAEMALAKTGDNRDVRQNLLTIFSASKKAEMLTNQILAFSRKQIFQPMILDITMVISELDKMMRRLIGEDINMEKRLVPHLPGIKADPSQIEQIIINLIVNARDAVNKRTDKASEKKITIETGTSHLDESYVAHHPDSQTGLHVFLAVSDTGCGMTEEVKQKAFEPFFSTKEKGKGTGMGLATVYGIVRQNKGNIYIYSELGKGTMIKVYWPATEENVPTDIQRKRNDRDLSGSEIILFVEDDGAVRQYAGNSLEGYGYRVHVAEDGVQALEWLKDQAEPPRLLVTDLVMPKMNGKELAERARALIPGIQVLFVSGYTENHIVHSGELEPDVVFLHKPYSAKDLAYKIRQLLDNA